MAKTKKAAKKTKQEVEPLKPKGTAKQDALERVISQIEKQYGQGAIMQMDERHYAKVAGIPTGSLSLDIALGGKGIPRGRVTEMFGPESSGKTTLALHVIANAQKAGGIAAFIDAEHALDTTWAKRLGVDVSSLLVSQPDTGEQALEIAEMLIRSNSVDVIVIDSVAALTPAAELQGEMGSSHMGLQARLMSQAMRKLTAVINKSKTSLIFINQIRMKIGVM
ncbi:MAG: recombinase RecA, partial [Planctomycetes bacterium]|nr:recombinase RecA [Planctomycetota bacterium]